MSESMPTMEVVRDALTFPRHRLGEPRPISPWAFDRFIAKVKADALREWAQLQEAALEASHHALDQDELNTTLAWIDDAKAYALRIEGKQ